MICQKCGLGFQEHNIDESHDVPCYMFEGKNRKEKKQKADKHGRHQLCKNCHNKYETTCFSFMLRIVPEHLRVRMRLEAKKFAERWFNGKANI